MAASIDRNTLTAQNVENSRHRRSRFSASAQRMDVRFASSLAVAIGGGRLSPDRDPASNAKLSPVG